MSIRIAEQNEADKNLLRVEQSQIDLIYKYITFSIFAIALAALLLFLLLNVRFHDPALDIWIAILLLVNLFGYVSSRHYSKRKQSRRVNYRIAKQLLLIFTVLTGLAWGGAGLFLIPLVNTQDKLTIVIISLAVVAELVTTLYYRYQFAITFILLVMLPMVAGVYISEDIAGLHPLVLNATLSIYLIFLIKVIMDLYRNTELMLTNEVQFVEREKELVLQSDRAVQTSRAKSEFLANMSHEMRTPMHAILGFSDLGANKSATAPPEKLQSYFTRINESGQRLLTILDSLIDLSNLEAGRMHFQFSKNDLRSTIDSAIGQLAPVLQERSVRVDVRSKTSDSTALYDNEKLIQVIKNLVSNSIKLSSSNSTVSIVIENASLPIASDSTDQAGNPAISVKVVGQGMGIPENELDSVFDKLMQSRKEVAITRSTDLGLPICKEIIQYHGGIIAADNNTSGGATFTFTIPVAGAADKTKVGSSH
ncbi:MAG: HAMP domain-containing sensor histidine kinase [Gammaproteobacteria bacterium]